jgi:hypothetical protein
MFFISRRNFIPGIRRVRMLISWTVGTVGLVLTAAVAATDQDRDNRSGFRERVPCIETGKFYRNGRGWKPLLVTTKFQLVFDFSAEKFTKQNPYL